MQILTSQQIRDWDQYTIAYEPVSSVDLMERAAMACYEWLVSEGYDEQPFSIFCGKGNNGGDGLAIARLLSRKNPAVSVHILEFGYLGTEDFQANLARLHDEPVAIRFISTPQTIPFIPAEDLVIDALLGSGLNRPLEGLTAALVEHLNRSGNQIISIDIPSGLSADQSSKSHTVVHATHTLSFQCLKPAFLLPENAHATGELHILDIGLHKDFPAAVVTDNILAGHELVRSFFIPRKKFEHKGDFGHALLIGGSLGKIGAILLSASACLRTGAGLVSVHAPGCGYTILQTAIPEAMVLPDQHENFNTALTGDLSIYKAIGIGPGCGTSAETGALVFSLLNDYRKPIVIDADALNLLSLNKDWLVQISPDSILTPHPREFDRLFGETANDLERISLASSKAKELGIIIVLKGHHTLIATPEGKKYFNSTGNPGMATGGSGDVLTGMITSLLAQSYSPAKAAVIAVYIHGLAGDLAAAASSMESLIASDIIDSIGQAFRKMY